MRKPSATAGKPYYHGTPTRNAYSIMTQGFRIGEETHGRWLGRGLYVAQELRSAWNWACEYGDGIIIACRLQPGTRVLWVHEGYDTRVIAYLKREFGKQLLDLGPSFEKAIPRNKQLTKNELIHLCNYVFEYRHKLALDDPRRTLWRRLAALSEHVRRHRYDAIGDRSFRYWDSDEVMVFNPSQVSPISAHRVMVTEWDSKWSPATVALSSPLDLATVRVLSEDAARKWAALLAEVEADENHEHAGPQ
jgi:hypothetical protein